VAVACLCPWDWLAALGAAEGLACVRGHALSRQALHGGKANNAQSASQKMAVRLRGGRRPHADGEPAERRAPRALWRRRPHLRRQRSARLAQVPPTNRPDHRPARGTPIASPTQRAGVAARLDAPAVPQTLAVALALLTSEAARRQALARALLPTAPPHAAPPLALCHTGPGRGPRRSLGRRDAIPASDRCARVPAGVSSCRLGTCARAAAGHRDGTAGQQSGPAPRQGAGAAAPGLCLRPHPAGPPPRARLANPPGQGPALTRLAHPRARAVSALRTRDTVLARAPVLPGAREQSGCA